MGAGSAGAPEGPPSPAWLPLIHADLQMAPCSCFFDLRVFCFKWMSTNPLPPDTSMLSHSAASLPGAALWGPWGWGTPPAWMAPGTLQGQLQRFTPFNLQGRTVASAPQVLPPCFPGYQDMERKFAHLSLSDTAIPVGAARSSSIPLGSHLSHCAGPHIQAVGDPAGDLPFPSDMLLDGSMVSQDGPSSVPMPEGPGDTSKAISHSNISSLSLPMELLTADYSTPETSNADQSLEQFNIIGMGPQEPWWDTGMDLPPAQPGRLEKRGTKRKSTFPNPPSKRRALAASTRVGSWD